MACLDDDLGRGDQFVRLEWLYAAVTICEKHRIPLRAREPLSALQRLHGRNGGRFTFHSGDRDLYLDFRRHRGPLSALSSFEQALKGALTGKIRPPALGGHEFIAVVTDLTWALLQKVANDGTRLAHHLEVEQFPVPPGWRAPIMLHTLSRVDLSFRQAILAIIACLLLPKYFAAMASTSSQLGRPDACSRLLRILRPEQGDALLARAQR